MQSRFFKILAIALFLTFSLGTLLLAVKGSPNNRYQYSIDGTVTGPYESTNSTSRYVFAQAMALHHRFTLTLDEARSAAPDLVYYNNQFQSIFMPGTAFISVPLLIVGSWFGAPQIGAYMTTVLLAVLNTFLVFYLARKLGASYIASLLAGLTFLFSTNAFAYALTLTQHHGGITVLLLSCAVALEKFSWRNAFAFGFLAGLGFLLDFPNLLLLFPVGVAMLTNAIHLKEKVNGLEVKIKPSILMIAVGFLPLIAILGWYNIQVSGSPTKIGQFLGRTNYFDTQQKKDRDEASSIESANNVYEPKLPFQTRIQLNGLVTLMISDERSWLYYSPVLLLGFFGMFSLLRDEKTKGTGVLLLSIISVNILIYSMFGDPWGGWSFGPRYLLPAASLMAVLVGVALSNFRSWIFTIAFLILVIYSSVISVAGALTSAAIPPKGEAQALINYVPYTYEFNFKLLRENKSGSLVFNSNASRFLTAYDYYYFVLAIVLVPLFILSGFVIIQNRKNAGVQLFDKLMSKTKK